jgi:PPP family 3-phenylpropionic acid transporter
MNQKQMIGWYKFSMLFQAAYFSGSAFFPVYWKEVLGYSDSNIGLLSALGILMSISGPFFFGHLGSRYPVERVLVLCFAMVAMVTPGLYFLRVPAAQLLFYSLIMFAQSGFSTLVPAGVMHILGKNAATEYGKYRRFGSIGYLVGVGLCGLMVQQWGAAAVLWSLLPTALLAGAPYLHLLKTPPPSEVATRFRAVLAQPTLVRFFVATLLTSWWRGPFFTFAGLRMREMGAEPIAVGWMFSLCGVTALVSFAAVGRLTDRMPTLPLYRLVGVIAAIRLLVLGLPEESIFWFFAIQLLHIPTFVVAESVQIRHLRMHCPPDLFPRAQAFLQSSISIGTALSAGLCGLLSERFGLPTAFMLSGIVPLAGILLVLHPNHSKAAAPVR